MRAVVILSIFLIFCMAPSVSAQIEPCDLNGNGFIDVGDLIFLMTIVGGADWIDSLPDYYFEWDCDRDKIHLTVSDPIGLANILIYGFGWGHGSQVESLSDSFYIPIVDASPGEEIDVPIYIYTDRILKALQLYVSCDRDFIDITNFHFSDSIPDYYWQKVYLFDEGISVCMSSPPDYDLEGFIGHLRIHILPDASPGVEIGLKFNNDPHRALYTGLASEDDFNDSEGLKLFFVHPVKIDGVIRIVDDGGLKSDGGSRLPVDFKFSPNPFNNSTRLTLELKENTVVKVAIYDLLGRQVALLVDANIPSGRHDIVWDAADLPSGIYLCHIRAGDISATEKITLLR